MFERLPLGGGPLVFLAILVPGLLSPDLLPAQATRDSLRQEYGAELERLVPVWKRLGASARAADSLRRAREAAAGAVPLDTFTVGPFRLVSQPRQREMAQGLFQDIWKDLEPHLLGAEDLLESRTFVVQRAWGSNRTRLEGDSLVYVRSSWRSPEWLFRTTGYHVVGRVLWEGVPEEVRDWAGAQGLPFSTNGFEWVARELASAPSIGARRCFTGDLDWCRRVLGLSEGEMIWERLYSPPERRLLVSWTRKPTNDARMAALWDGCVEFGETGACDLVLAETEFRLPLSRSARGALISVSLRIGGEGSFHRLLQAQGRSVEESLAMAAGMPPDSLVASWRREVLEDQTSAWAGLARTPAAVLIWLALLGLLATRSTRWRLG